MERLCEYCQTSFTPKRVDMYYCSHSCRQMAYLKRKNQAYELGNELKQLTYPLNNIETQKVQAPKEISNTNSEASEDDIERVKELKENPFTNSVDGNNIISHHVDKENIQPAPSKEDYTAKESIFIKELTDLSNERDYINDLSILYYQKCEATAWVIIRYRCLVECLLTFSEMKQIELDDLKEVCNAFTELINSKYFIYLPVKFPYTEEIEATRNSLKQICLNADEDEPLNFKLQYETKKKMIITRWELAHYAQKRSFSQLNFKTT